MHFTEAKGILSQGNGMNIYRGCSHGCIYCDARSVCYRFKHDFDDIEVKSNAAVLLEDALRRKRKPCMIGTGAMGDPYIHAEEHLCLMRRCLEVIERYGCGIAVQTKSSRILRDCDLYEAIHRKARAVVELTVTTADEDLCRLIEPNVSTTAERVGVFHEMKKRGIPTVAWFSPFLPYINDTEENMHALLDMTIGAGVRGIIFFSAGVMMREGNREFFYNHLDRLFPGLKKVYEREFGLSYECTSRNNPKLSRIFHETCEKYGVIHDIDKVFAFMHDFPQSKRHESAEQLSMF